MWWRAVLALAVGLTLGACAPTPRGPSVMVLPGSGKTLDEFQLDDATCRQWAAQHFGGGGDDSWMAQRRYDIAFQQCMYSRGHQVPEASRSGRPMPSPVPVPGQRVPVPPPSAGTPPPDAPPPPTPTPGR